MTLAGKTIFMSGGSRGIGLAIALRAARDGANIAIAAKTAEPHAKLEGTIYTAAEQIRAVGGQALPLAVDIRDAERVAGAVRETVEKFGGIDILINNAGVVSHQMIEDLDLDEWHRVIDTNLTAVFLITKAALPAMEDGGSIVNITSAVAMRGMPARTHYISSKAGLIGFTRALSKEVGRKGIRVNALAPGIIETDQTAGLDEAGRARYSGLAALNRLGQSEEIAAVALFLASDLASFVSGVTLNVDGGI
jgi:3-oxoacyl-[acyl-carrier protein] reductase